jgi:hypothetical protein
VTATAFECGHDVAGAVVSIANDAPAPGLTVTVGLGEVPNMSLVIRRSCEASLAPCAFRSDTVGHPDIRQEECVTFRIRTV